MIPNPVRKVLSSMRAHRVRALLMGGQACVFYGAAEFSRDTAFAILASAANLARLRKALSERRAERIASEPDPAQARAILFWFHELRTPELLLELERVKGIESCLKILIIR